MLNKVLLIILILFAILMIVFFTRGKASQKGQALGLTAGKLAACSKKPNCVCSEYPDDEKHFIDPIDVSQVNMGLHFKKVASAIQATGGVIIKQSDEYLAATYTSTVFKFVDDVEIRLDKNSGLIHLRSASREGYSDLGANAKRIAAIKKAYKGL